MANEMVNTQQNKGLVTGLVTALGTVIFAFFQENGFPATTTAWEILGIIVVLNGVQYAIKNAIAPSNSAYGTINLRDIISGLVLAVCNGLSVWAASAITSTTLDWKLLLSTAGGFAATYIATKFGFGQKKANITSVDNKTLSNENSGDSGGTEIPTHKPPPQP